MLRNSSERWGALSQALHWLIVLLILAQGTIGLLMDDMRNGPDKIEVYAQHKSIGLSILALAVLRLGWRLVAGSPRGLPGTPRWQRHVASTGHALLYVLLLALPLSGWLLNSAAGFPLQWFSLFNLPPLADQDELLRAQAGAAHEWLFWLLCLMASLHAAAAFYHHLFLRDATLSRMLPRGWLSVGQPATEIRRDDP